MQVNLTFAQRLLLASLIPAEVASFREMRNAATLRGTLALSEEERVEANVQSTGGRISWNAEAAARFDNARFDFTSGEVNLIAETFLALEREGKVPTDPTFIDLYAVFEDEIAKTEGS